MAGLPPAFIGVGAIDLFVDGNLTNPCRLQLVSSGLTREHPKAPSSLRLFT
jgi:hypothetical protein